MSVSPGGGDLWAGGRAGDAGPPLRVVARAEGAGPPPAGARAGGARRGAAESGNLRAGGRRAASSGRRGRGEPPGPASSRRRPAGRLSPGGAGPGPAVRPSRPAGGRVPAAVDTHLAWPAKPTVAPGFWEPVLLLCHFVPAPASLAARRPSSSALCMIPSSCASVFLAKPPAQCRNDPEVPGGRRRAALSLAEQR